VFDKDDKAVYSTQKSYTFAAECS